MSVRSIRTEGKLIYYLTFTCNNWLPLFEQTTLYDAIYRWFKILHEKEFRIVGFVIMPNHLHLLMYMPDGKKLNTTVSNGKRFLAYEIVKRLEEAGDKTTLQLLKDSVTPSDKKRGKLHQVFIRSFDSRKIIDADMFFQKLRYIHQNPVRGKWNLAADFIAYPHSSASWYEEDGKAMPFPMTHFREL